MANVLADKHLVMKADANPPAMMVRPAKSYSPWVTSATWDGGRPEMERSLGEIFQGNVLAIKYPGTTVDELGAKFLRYNYMVLGALSLLMAGGITLFLRRRIIRPLSDAAQVADRIAKGQLQTEIPSGGNDETGALLKSMTVMIENLFL